MTIQQYLCALFVNLFINVGIWTAFRPQMILGPIGDWLFMKAPAFIHKPLFSCPQCMSSVWGTAFFFAFGLNDRLPSWAFIPHVLALCGLTSIAMFLDHER